MRAVDAWAIEEQGVPSLDLMERAGAGLARVTAAAARPGPVRVVVGKGNNGGDGLVVARLLREDGHEVDVLAARRPRRAARRRAGQPGAAAGRPPEPFDAERLDGSGVVVDALLGTGFEGAPREPLAGGDRRDQRPGRAGGGLRRALRRRTPPPARSRARPSRARPPRPSTAQDRPVRDARQGARRAGRGGRDRHPARRAGAGGAGLIRERVLELYPRRGAQRLEVRVRAWSWWPAARAASPARPRWPRAPPSARARATCRWPCPAPAQPAVDLRLLEQMSRGLPDDGRLPHARGRGDGRGDGRARRRRGAGPRARPRRRRAGVRPRRGARRCEVPLLVDADGLNAHAGRLELFARARRRRPCSRRTRASSAGCWSATRPRSRAHRLACAREAARAQRRGGAAEGRRHARGAARAAWWRSARAARPRWPPRAPATCSPA